jgi:hypothetical protein
MIRYLYLALLLCVLAFPGQSQGTSKQFMLFDVAFMYTKENDNSTPINRIISHRRADLDAQRLDDAYRYRMVLFISVSRI